MNTNRLYEFVNENSDVIVTSSPRALLEAQADGIEANKVRIHEVYSMIEAQDIQDILASEGVLGMLQTTEFINFTKNVAMYAKRKREAGKLQSHRLNEYDMEDYMSDVYTGSWQVLSTEFGQSLAFDDVKYLVSVVAYHCFDHHAYIVGRRGSHVDLDSINEDYAIEALDNKAIRAHKALVQATEAQAIAEVIPQRYIESVHYILDKAEATRFFELLSKRVTDGVTKTEAKAYQRLVHKLLLGGKKADAETVKTEKAIRKARKQAFEDAIRADKKAKAQANKEAREAQKARGKALREEAQLKRVEKLISQARDIGMSDEQYYTMLANRREAKQAELEARRVQAKQIRQILKGTL
jgi:hypothetical protein